MRHLLSVLLLVLVAACGGAVDPTDVPDNGEEAVTTTAPDPAPTTTEGEAVTATTSIPATTVPDPERPLAPDFTLELGEGGDYTLSEGARPVYLIFWAEW